MSVNDYSFKCSCVVCYLTLFRMGRGGSKKSPPPPLPVCSNPYKIKVMITSLIEMLQLPNFGLMTTSTEQFESRDKVWLVTS